MNSSPLVLDDVPELSDEAAAHLLEVLYALTTAFENHYLHQLRRYYEPDTPPQPDLFEDFNDELPDF